MKLRFKHLGKEFAKKYEGNIRKQSSSKDDVIDGIKTIVCDLYIARGLDRKRILEVFHPMMHDEISRYMDGLDSGKADLHWYQTRKTDI